MVHELIGINNGRVDLSKISDIKPDLKVIYYYYCYYCLVNSSFINIMQIYI